MLDKNLVFQTIQRQLLPLTEWLEDRLVVEINVNPGGHTFIEKAGIRKYVGQLLDEHSISMAIKGIAKLIGDDAISGSLSSIVNANFGDFRVSGALKPVSPQGSFLSIRKHLDAESRPTLDDLVKKEALSKKDADLIVDLLISKKINTLFVGGTGSGKTTLLNAILAYIPVYERVGVIEDAKELAINLPDMVAMQSSVSSGITVRDLVKLALRQTFSRLILSETRGDETFDLLRGLNSGHEGSATTLHANSAELGLAALEMMFQMSLPANASISSDICKRYIANSVGAVVFLSKQTVMVDDEAVVTRKVREICLVKGVENGKYVLESLI